MKASFYYIFVVALFTGAWIEIDSLILVSAQKVVALFTGAWIEMLTPKAKLPELSVALFTGAWIEITNNEPIWLYSKSRTLYGCVD